MPVLDELRPASASAAGAPPRAAVRAAHKATSPRWLPRLIPSLDTSPQLLSFARTMPGRLVIVVIFTALLAALNTAGWWAAGPLLAACSLFPAHRKALLAIGAICWVFVRTPIEPQFAQIGLAHGAASWMRLWPAAVLAVWVIAGGLGWVMGRWPASLGRRPLVVLLIVLGGLLLASGLPARGARWFAPAILATIFARYVWFFAYWLADRRSGALKGLPQDVAYWRPFWGFTTVPFGKGPAYLERVEARDEGELARVQLKALKLLLWAAVLTCVKVVFDRARGESNAAFINHILSWIPSGVLPTYAHALACNIQGHPYPLYMRWLALIGEFLAQVVALTVLGHKIVAVCRMAGFNIFRNTYRPFTSPTIAEFYNRVYYYFKELLATFFFYPTYLRYFKRHPRLRLFVATLAAAGLGNFVFHFLREEHYILQFGFWGALKIYHTYAVYCLILGVAIALSQMRMLDRNRRTPSGPRKALAVAGVLTFYCFMTVFAAPDPSRNIVHYGSYVASLFCP